MPVKGYPETKYPVSVSINRDSVKQKYCSKSGLVILQVYRTIKIKNKTA
jgi:hypothetical protein